MWDKHCWDRERSWAGRSWGWKADTDFGPLFFGISGHRGHKRGGRMFEQGDLKLVILRLLEEKPRHGYEIIKSLEDSLHGWYTPSPGTIYPTLQLLEDQGLVRGVETDGRRIYHLTPEGERYLEQHKSVLDDIAERLRDAVHDVAGGAMGELHTAFASVARATYPRVFKTGADHPALPRITQLLKQTAVDIEQAWKGDAPTSV